MLEIYFRFRFRLFARNLHIILHQAIPNFVQIEAFTAEIWRHIHFSRWRPRRLNTTSGFVSVDVTAFRRSKSISKPNFVEISQMEAEIYFFLWQSKMAWEGVKFNFSKSRMCQYPMVLCYILWIQKCIFDACRLSLHNSTPSHCTNKSRDHSFFTLIGQSPHSCGIPLIWPTWPCKYTQTPVVLL